MWNEKLWGSCSLCCRTLAYIQQEEVVLVMSLTDAVGILAYSLALVSGVQLAGRHLKECSTAQAAVRVRANDSEGAALGSYAGVAVLFES